MNKLNHLDLKNLYLNWLLNWWKHAILSKKVKDIYDRTLDKKFLKDFKIKPSETLVNLNNTKLDP